MAASRAAAASGTTATTTMVRDRNVPKTVSAQPSPTNTLAVIPGRLRSPAAQVSSTVTIARLAAYAKAASAQPSPQSLVSVLHAAERAISAAPFPETSLVQLPGRIRSPQAFVLAETTALAHLALLRSLDAQSSPQSLQERIGNYPRAPSGEVASTVTIARVVTGGQQNLTRSSSAFVDSLVTIAEQIAAARAVLSAVSATDTLARTLGALRTGSSDLSPETSFVLARTNTRLITSDISPETMAARLTVNGRSVSTQADSNVTILRVTGQLRSLQTSVSSQVSVVTSTVGGVNLTTSVAPDTQAVYEALRSRSADARAPPATTVARFMPDARDASAAVSPQTTVARQFTSNRATSTSVVSSVLLVAVPLRARAALSSVASLATVTRAVAVPLAATNAGGTTTTARMNLRLTFAATEAGASSLSATLAAFHRLIAHATGVTAISLSTIQRFRRLLAAAQGFTATTARIGGRQPFTGRGGGATAASATTLMLLGSLSGEVDERVSVEAAAAMDQAAAGSILPGQNIMASAAVEHNVDATVQGVVDIEGVASPFINGEGVIAVHPLIGAAGSVDYGGHAAVEIHVDLETDADVATTGDLIPDGGGTFYRNFASAVVIQAELAGRADDIVRMVFDVEPPSGSVTVQSAFSDHFDVAFGIDVPQAIAIPSLGAVSVPVPFFVRLPAQLAVIRVLLESLMNDTVLESLVAPESITLYAGDDLPTLRFEIHEASEGEPRKDLTGATVLFRLRRVGARYNVFHAAQQLAIVIQADAGVADYSWPHPLGQGTYEAQLTVTDLTGRTVHSPMFELIVKRSL